MPDHLKNRKSVRIKEYDYSQPGYYYITICTHQREQPLGKIINGQIELSNFGVIIKEELNKTENLRSNIKIDYYQVMPNHIHLILIIDKKLEDTARRVPTEAFGVPVQGSLSTIIRSFKSACSKRINELRKTPGSQVWQSLFFEHIIRNDKELYEIRKYIEFNPLNWEDDEYNKLY